MSNEHPGAEPDAARSASLPGAIYPDQKIHELCAEIGRLKAELATAREAGRQEGLEEALRKATDLLMDAYKSTPMRNSIAHEIADAIRVLVLAQPATPEGA